MKLELIIIIKTEGGIYSHPKYQLTFEIFQNQVVEAMVNYPDGNDAAKIEEYNNRAAAVEALILNASESNTKEFTFDPPLKMTTYLFFD
jgi:hypothetical protein